MPERKHPNRRRIGRIAAVVLYAALLAVLGTSSAVAAVTVLVGEPFGSFGTMMPVGHTAIYLDRVCADGPLKLRMCHPGEPQGVVIARYHGIDNLDWLASPVMQFLYATDRPEDVLSFATLENSWDLREAYREKYLSAIIPDGTEYNKATNEWWESAGMAYTRRTWGYQLATTREQDELLVAFMNERTNHHSYRLRGNNCADFAAQILNLYFPGSVRTNRFADLGLMSPKQVARSVEQYGQFHPELNLRVFEIPQVPGSIRRSRPVRGGVEGLLKTKRYLATLLVIQPEVPLVCMALYLDRGRWKIGRNADVVDADAFTGLAEPLLSTR